ncbi:MAG TPA: hypothetical protein VNJ54_12650 [Plantibacter sp.]|uniref:hypothetical protein n=1 Tax=Plantibacter sp. TaxID=1871045 RepID=UPI002BB927BA|nr:hypothetical protein [Plantibacter sp.]
MISDFDRANLDSILVGHGDWFTAHLLRLIAKADPVNRARLRAAFPAEVQAFESWRGDDNARHSVRVSDVA